MTSATQTSATQTSQVHFVVGSGRCGSSLTHEILCRHENVEFISNVQDRQRQLGDKLASFNNRLFRALPPSVSTKGRVRFAPSEAYAVLEREVGPLVVDPYRDLLASDATAGLSQRLRTFFESSDRPADHMMLHKFTGWPRARMLAEVFPHAKFVQVTRDPRDVVSSWLRMPWWRGHYGPAGWHFGELTPAQTETWEQSGQSFAVLAALGWQAVIDAGVASKVDLGPLWLDIKYEDLCGDPVAALSQVAEHLGLEVTNDWLEQIARYTLENPKSGSDRQWSEIGDDLALVESACARGMELFGYETASHHFNVVSEAAGA